MFWGCSPRRAWGGIEIQSSKDSPLGHMRCCCQLSGVSLFQNLKIQRSVGRAKDGTTFPLSLKLKSKPSSEEAEDGKAAPKWGYSASIWVFSTISGLITLLPDGTIYGINHSFALMLFGYGKTELLGKVGPSPECWPRPLWGSCSVSHSEGVCCHRPCASLFLSSSLAFPDSCCLLLSLHPTLSTR